MLKTVLIILTLSEVGTTHLAMTEATSMQDCRDKADVVGQILTSSGSTIVAMGCGETDLSFVPYEHGYTEADMRWHYHVALKGHALEDGFTITPMPEGTCEIKEAQTEFCTVSAQGPITEQ